MADHDRDPATAEASRQPARGGASTRLFVVFTRDEALALVARTHRDIAARVRGLAKIRTALDGAVPVVKQSGQIDEKLSFEHPRCAGLKPPALSSQPAIAVPPLRAKTYRPMTAPTCRIAKAVRPSPSHTAGASPAVDEYVPWRDEAGGIYE